MKWLGEMNDKMQELSKALLGLHVKDVFKKNEDGLRVRELSEDEKEKIRDLYRSLEQQVNDFVNKTKKKVSDEEAEIQETAKKTRTTLRDKFKKK